MRFVYPINLYSLADGLLPIEISHAKTKLDAIGIAYNRIWRLSGHATSGNPKVQTIVLSHFLDTAKLPQIIIHELLHSISGRTFLVDNLHLTSANQIGLQYKRTSPNLNEAITEYLTKVICQHAQLPFDPNHAHQEIKRWESIRKNGEFEIDRNLFIKAYFEDILPHEFSSLQHPAARAQNLKYTRELFKQLKTAYPKEEKVLNLFK